MDSMKIVHVNHLLDWFREIAYDLHSWIGSAYAFQYIQTDAQNDEREIGRDGKKREKLKIERWIGRNEKKNPNRKQNKTESKYWAHKVLSAHCDQFHFILSFVHCIFCCFFCFVRVDLFSIILLSFLHRAIFPRYFLLLFVSFFCLSFVLYFFPVWFFNWELSSECLFRACLSHFHLYTIESDL